MDGTIIDSNMAHYNAYKKVFSNYNKDFEFINFNEWNNIILNDSFSNYLYKIFDENTVNNIKNQKIDMLKEETILFTKNSDIFLQYLIDNNFNFCIVTNTNKETVEIFKQKLPLLNKIKQWVCREDYKLPKPNSECYELAKCNFYNGEKYILGMEDSMVGYQSLKSVTDLIYIYKNELLFKNNDCYLFDDFNTLLHYE
jgi:beta-phosphoglucomutase-like phosphatase (HAD superfamily)